MDDFIRTTTGQIALCPKCETELDVFCVCANSNPIACDNCCGCEQH